MQEQDGDSEPAHHARRPMNAFLIFCKRHRSVVRDKYPNLENRSITKILGEWWANLEKEEKACYTGLAKQYKDAFFNANPDFKWYKLPAPPLRTLSSRPRDVAERPIERPIERPHEPTDQEKINNNSTKLDFNKKTAEQDIKIERKTLSMFTPGKLADEAQMGGLSSLLATKTETQTPNPYYSPPSYKFTTLSNSEDFRSHTILEKAKSKGLTREESIRELQDALSETTRMFEEDFDAEQQVYARNDQFTNQDVIDQIVDKRYSKDDDPRNWSDDDKKSGRSCKGKRYQEFMAIGGLIVNKRQKRDYNDRMPDDDLASCSWEPGYSRSEDSTVIDESKLNITSSEISAENDGNNEADAIENDNMPNKTFKPADFDLDAKIRALPSLSLEKFQQKKRENKRKKKTLNLKPKALESAQIINSVPYYEDRRSMAESWRETVIGSQKRKPRKVSITRLEINSLVSHDDATKTQQSSPEIKIATEAPASALPALELCRPPAFGLALCRQPPGDLLALATLAEVAATRRASSPPRGSPPSPRSQTMPTLPRYIIPRK